MQKTLSRGGGRTQESAKFELHYDHVNHKAAVRQANMESTFPSLFEGSIPYSSSYKMLEDLSSTL